MANFTRKLLLVALVFSSSALWAQTGNYFLSHYSPSQERFDYVCFDMAQDNKGVMYYATKAGILEFDGRDWDLLQGESSIYSLQISEDNITYWGGSKGFGRVSLDVHGFQQIETLSDSTVANAFQTLVVNEKVYYLTEDAVYVLDTKSSAISSIKKSSAENTFIKLFELFGAVYVNTPAGVKKIDGEKLIDSKLKLTGEVVFSSRIENAYIIATADNVLFSCNENLEIKPIPLRDQAYVSASVITSATWSNRQLLAIGTLRGGVIFVNPLNGMTEEIINYTTGLPDNEVFTLMTDVNQDVWVAHDYGFTRISPFTPLRSFSHYQGLQGNLLCAYSSQNTVYVGTSLGLFKLEKQDLFDEVVYYVDVEIKEPTKASKNLPVNPSQETPAQEPQKVESKKKGLFNFLKRKDKSAQETVVANKPTTPTTTEEPATTLSQPRFKKVKKTERIPRAASYSFKKVQGIEAKISHLAEVDGKLLASGLGGLYEINNLSSKVLIEEPIRFIFAPENSDIVIVSTYNDEVRSLRFDGKIMENSSVFNNLDDQIHFAFQGPNELWLCGLDRIYRAEIKGSDVRHKQTVELNQRNIDKTVGAVLNDKVILVNADGFYNFDRKTSAISVIDSLPKPSQYFIHNGGIVYHDQHGWKFLGAAENSNDLSLLNVFEKLRFIASDKNQKNLWIISGENELYKFFGEKVAPPVKDYPLFLKSIYYQNKKIINYSEIHMDQEHSTVRFKVVQPDYINPNGMEFRYILNGMSQEWSEWSNTNNIIDIPFLPNGDYKLQVEARNIFGKVSELEPVVFEVLPPYWRRPWFYALEFSIFAAMVMLSFRLSTRFRIVSRLLSLLTIILLIEFIQTVIGESILTKNSPVIDFFIQVVVALLVLPVEGYLRNLMLKSLDSSGKFYQFMVAREAPKIMTKEMPEKFVKDKTEV